MAPQTNGAMIAITEAIQFVMDIMVPAKFGLRSMWLIWNPQRDPAFNPTATTNILTATIGS